MAVVTTYDFVINYSQNYAFFSELAVVTAAGGFIFGGTDGFGTTSALLADPGFVASSSFPVGTNLALAYLGFGNYVAVTQDADSIRYELFSSGGVSYTGSLDIGQAVSSNPDVAALQNGNIVIASQQTGGLFTDIYLDFIDGAGNHVGVVQVAAGSVGGPVHSDPSIVVLSNGNIAVGWVQTLGGESEIWTAVFTQAGAVVTGPTLVDTDGLINDAVELTVSGTGYAMAYNDTDGGLDLGNVEVRTFDANGNALNNVVLDNFSHFSGSPAIATLSNGMLAVSWYTVGNGYIINSLVDPTTMAVLTQEFYEPSISYVIAFPELAALGSGRLVQFAHNQSFGSGELAEMTVRRVMTGDALANTINAQNDLSHHLLGEDGIDRLYGGALADVLDGGNGNDTLDGKGGGDLMRGGAGNDSYLVNSDFDVIIEDVGGGTDKVTSTALSYILYDNVENLTLGSGAVGGHGNSGNNAITGNSAANTLSGQGGNDKLDGKAGADTMDGGDGNDNYFVDNLFDNVIETNAAAAGGRDTVNISYAGAYYTLGANVENGNLTGSGVQTLVGNGLANTLTSKGNSNATIHSLAGLGGRDILKGATGQDLLVGGAGADMLTGGGGTDFFQFDVLETSANKDTIKDFSHADDRIDIFSSAYAGLAGAAGHLLSDNAATQDMFHLGTSAGDAEDRIIYDSGTGNLYYDADGLGGAAQILVALLSTKPVNVDASDFYIY